MLGEFLELLLAEAETADTAPEEPVLKVSRRGKHSGRMISPLTKVTAVNIIEEPRSRKYPTHLEEFERTPPQRRRARKRVQSADPGLPDVFLEKEIALAVEGLIALPNSGTPIESPLPDSSIVDPSQLVQLPQLLPADAIADGHGDDSVD